LRHAGAGMRLLLGTLAALCMRRAAQIRRLWGKVQGDERGRAEDGRHIPGVTRTVAMAIADDVQALPDAAASQTALLLLVCSLGVRTLTSCPQRQGKVWYQRMPRRCCTDGTVERSTSPPEPCFRERGWYGGHHLVSSTHNCYKSFLPRSPCSQSAQDTGRS
jgi:hypothetical protein